MDTDTESPRREMIKAGAGLERFNRMLSHEFSAIVNIVSVAYMEKVCNYIVKLFEVRRESDTPPHFIIDNKTQHLLDYVFIDFDKTLREELLEASDGKVTVAIERDFGVVGSTKITVQAA